MKEEEERRRTTTVMYAESFVLLLYSKNCSSFFPSARSLLFLFFSLEERERVVGRVFVFLFYEVGILEKNRKKTPHKIKRYRSENQKVSRGAVRLDASKLSNSACIRYSSLFRSYFQPSHLRCGFLFVIRRRAHSRALAWIKTNFFRHKFRTLEICIDRSFTHPPFYNFPSN